MPIQTLERRPRLIPRRAEVASDPAPARTRATAPEPVSVPVTLRRPLAPAAPLIPVPDTPVDPAAGLTRAERQARRRRSSGRASAARHARVPRRAPVARTVPVLERSSTPRRNPTARRAPVARRGRVRRLLGDVVIFGLIAVLLFFTWPVRFGGATTFVVVHGHSMDPTFRSGDLVVVRKADSYQVGDIAAYRVPKGTAGAGGGVIHRIVRREGDHYVFKGDNRTTEDQWRPRASDIMGRLALRMPMPGETFWALLPWTWCVGVGVVVAWMFWPQAGRRRPGRVAT